MKYSPRTALSDVYYGPVVGGLPVHDILRGTMFYGSGPAPVGGRLCVLLIDLQFYTESKQATLIGDAQVPQQGFLAAGAALFSINVPPVRGGDSPIPVSQDPGDFDPSSEEYGAAYNGNGCNTMGAGDVDDWPGTNHTTNATHPLADPTWLSAHKAVLHAVQYLKQNAVALGINPDLIVPWGDSAGGNCALWALCQPNRAGKLGGEGDQAAQSTRVAGAGAYRPGNVWLDTLDPTLNGWPHTDELAADDDEPADTYADIDALERVRESVVQIGSIDTDYPFITAQNNAKPVWIGSATAMSAAAAADANRYVHPFPVGTETNTHSILAGYIAKSVWNGWRLVAVTGSEDAGAGGVTNGQAADYIAPDIDTAWLDSVSYLMAELAPTPAPVKPHTRDLEGSLMVWLNDRLAGAPAVLPSGLRMDTMQLDAYARVTIEHEVRQGPAGGIYHGDGTIDLDIRSARTTSGDGTVRLVSLLQTTIDQVRDVLERTRVPVFNLYDFDARAGRVGTLQAAIAADATSLVVVGGDVFDGGPWEVAAGGERIAYTTRVDGSGIATLSGLTRGYGDTIAQDHPVGAPVADALGDPVAFIHTDGFSVRHLPFDVAEQRNRAIIRLPFTTTYSHVAS